MSYNFSEADKLMSEGKLNTKEISEVTGISCSDLEEHWKENKTNNYSEADRLIEEGKLSIEEIAKATAISIDSLKEHWEAKNK